MPRTRYGSTSTMHPHDGAHGRVRFGTFEMDLVTGEIRRAGVPVHLPAQPTAVLRLLVEQADSLVSREEIGRRLWYDRWEEFDPGINTCISQIRSALGDSATSPTFIATVPRRGYRFVAPLEWLPPETSRPAGSTGTAHAGPDAGTGDFDRATPASVPLAQPRPGQHGRRWNAGWILAVSLALVLAASAILAAVDRAIAPESDPRLMLAVLPFETMDADSALDYVAAGLTEELITLLANVEPARLGVIARTSSVAAARSEATVARIGETLGADYVVEGAIRSGTDRVRITAQLIRVADQSHLWAESFDRPVVDVLDVQRDVARRVTGALALTLVTDTDAPEARPAPSPARLHTLEARWLLDRGAGNAERALVLLDSAIAADSSYAPAWTARARALAAQTAAAAPDIERVRDAARRAVALDDSQVEAHLRLAGILYQRDWDPAGAELEFRRADAIAPGRADVHHARALFLAATGRFDEADLAIEEAMRLDPVSTLVVGDAAFVHFLARDYDRAAAFANRVLALDPDNINTLSLLVNLAAVRGRPEETVRYGVSLSRAVRGPDTALDPTAYADVSAAYEAFWRSWVGWWRANTSGPLRAYQAAAGFVHLGQPDSALAELAAAYGLRQGGLAFLAADPTFDVLHERPVFRAIVRGIGLMPDPASSYEPVSN